MEGFAKDFLGSWVVAVKDFVTFMTSTPTRTSSKAEGSTPSRMAGQGLVADGWSSASAGNVLGSLGSPTVGSTPQVPGVINGSFSQPRPRTKRWRLPGSSR